MFVRHGGIIMPKGPLEELLRKPVVIRANGIEYRGILIEVSPTEIVLRSPTSQISIPMDRVISVTDPSKKTTKDPSKFVDPSYYKDE
jgi:hypothetical protein